MQKKETWVVVDGDALYHGTIDSIVDRASESVGGGFLAFQFVLSAAVLADVVLDRGVGLGFVDGNRAADGAVHIAGEPVFCEDAGLLGGAFVALNQGGVEC